MVQFHCRTRLARGITVFLCLALTSGCALAQDSDWAWIDVERLISEARSVEPGGVRERPEDSPGEQWQPQHPFPSFVEGNSYAGNPGRSEWITSRSQPDEDEIKAYIATLFDQGWVIDIEASDGRFLVLNELEWMYFSNSPTVETANGMIDRTLRDPSLWRAEGFAVHWTREPWRVPGWCPNGTAQAPDCINEATR